MKSGILGTNNKAFTVGPVAAGYVRIKVDTKSTAASTLDVVVTAK